MHPPNLADHAVASPFMPTTAAPLEPSVRTRLVVLRILMHHSLMARSLSKTTCDNSCRPKSNTRTSARPSSRSMTRLVKTHLFTGTSCSVQLASSGDYGVHRMSPSNRTTSTAAGGYSSPPPCVPRTHACHRCSTASCHKSPSSRPGARNIAPSKVVLPTQGTMLSIPCFVYTTHVSRSRFTPSTRSHVNDELNSSVHTFVAFRISSHVNALPVATTRSTKLWI